MASRSDRHAFMTLLELVRSPNARSAHALVQHDWSRLPRVQAAGLSAMDPIDFDGVARSAKELLRSACEELDSRRVRNGDRQHPLDVFEMHILEENATWDSIMAYREEQGLPRVSERTLRNRQNEAVKYLLEWAGTAVAGGGGATAGASESEPLKPEAPATTPARHRSSHQPSSRQPSRTWLVGMAVIVGVLASAWAFRIYGERQQAADTESHQDLAEMLATIPQNLIGIHLEPPNPAGSPIFAPHTDDVIRDLELPLLDSPVQSVMLVPLDDQGRRAILLGTARGGDAPGHLVLWDPVDDEILWEISYQPDPDKVLTHTGLQEETRAEAYAARFLAYGGPERNLGTRFAAIYMQRMSPTFVIFVDIATGTITGEYAHPGHLYSRGVYDLDGDGRQELVLAGCDNSKDRAVLLALDPTMGEGAASTVQWNEDHREAARFRVMFPRFPEWEAMSQQPRMDAYGIEQNCWYPDHERLVVELGYMSRSEWRAYYAYLRNGSEVVPGHTIVLGDEEERGWRELGLDIEATKRRLEEGSELIRP